MHFPFLSVDAQVSSPFRAVAARCFFVTAFFFLRLTMLTLHPAHPARAFLSASPTIQGNEVLADAMTPQRSRRFVSRFGGAAMVLWAALSALDYFTPLECGVGDLLATSAALAPID